jgi:hypothetical protein
MATTNELQELLQKTGPIRELLTSIRREPVRLLTRINEEYERTGQPVPDHRLGAGHYLSGVLLRALQEAGLVEEASPGRRFVRAYLPTQRGQEYARRIRSESA